MAAGLCRGHYFLEDPTHNFIEGPNDINLEMRQVGSLGCFSVQSSHKLLAFCSFFCIYNLHIFCGDRWQIMLNEAHGTNKREPRKPNALCI